MIKNYDEFILCEKFTSSNYDLIYEKNVYSQFRELIKKVLKDYGTQLYFVFTFNAAIIALLPIINEVIYKSNHNIHVTNLQIVMITIFAIAEILHVNNDAIRDIFSKLKDEGVAEIIKDVKNIIINLENIVKIISRTMGKTISFFTDMVGYVTMLIPINNAITEIINSGQLEPDTLSKKIGGLGIGLGIFAIKHIIIRIFDKLGINIKKIEKKLDDSIKKEMNIYHNMRTKEKIQK